VGNISWCSWYLEFDAKAALEIVWRELYDFGSAISESDAPFSVRDFGWYSCISVWDDLPSHWRTFLTHDFPDLLFTKNQVSAVIWVPVDVGFWKYNFGDPVVCRGKAGFLARFRGVPLDQDASNLIELRRSQVTRKR
jgi:hypothetical protein